MTNPDITILLATYRRPEMLRLALNSIRTQKAVAQIREVIVSENGDPSGAASVCEEFRESLPIRYVLRDPPTSALEHERILYRETYASKYVAILHDDDEWAPDHLQRALRWLEKHPTASACGTAFCAITTEGDGAPHDRYQYDAFRMFWFGSDFQPATQEWVLAPEAVILSCLPGTPLHYSTLVIRNPCLAKCVYIYDFKNRYDPDRMLLLALARQGPIVYDPTPSVLIRIHAEQGVKRFTLEEILQYVGRTTSWALEYAEELKFDFLPALYRRLADCPPADLPGMTVLFSRSWVRDAVEQADRSGGVTDDEPRSRGKILFVSHSATSHAAATSLLGLLRWLRQETAQEFELILGKDNPLAGEFSQTVRAYSFEAIAQWPEFLRRSFLRQFELIYADGCWSGSLFTRLPSAREIPLVTQLHEPDAEIDAFGARNVAELMRQTRYFIASSIGVAHRWRHRFRVPEERIAVCAEVVTPPAVAASGRELWRLIGRLRQPASPLSVRHLADCGLCDILTTWRAEEAPDRDFVRAKLARHSARGQARSLVAEGRAADAVQILIHAVRVDGESKDPHRILEGLLEIGADLAPLDETKARYLGVQAEKLAQAIGSDLPSVRAHLAREAPRVRPESSQPGLELAAASVPETSGQLDPCRAAHF